MTDRMIRVPREELRSITTDGSGTTEIITMTNTRLVLTPEASQSVLDHLLKASRVIATLVSRGRR